MNSEATDAMCVRVCAVTETLYSLSCYAISELSLHFRGNLIHRVCAQRHRCFFQAPGHSLRKGHRVKNGECNTQLSCLPGAEVGARRGICLHRIMASEICRNSAGIMIRIIIIISTLPASLKSKAWRVVLTQVSALPTMCL